MPTRGRTTDFDRHANPLLSQSATVWERLIDAVGPASLLVVIETRMSAGLKGRLTPEDILQDTLLHAWRDRAQCTWRGLRSFRAWLLTIIDNRIRDAAVYETAQKRGAGKSPVPFSALGSSDTGTGASGFPGPIISTTPSRVAMYREQAAAMAEALQALPDDVRGVVGLRLLEQLPMGEIAMRLGIGVEAVRHRFRKGAGIYRRRLMTALASRSIPAVATNPDASLPVSSPNE